MKEFDFGIIGGGPAGSFVAFLLAAEGYSVSLFEKKIFPRETLCGEFLSYEVSAHLKDAGLFEGFLNLNPNIIKTFKMFTSRDKSVKADLKFIAFGLKRSAFDKYLLDESEKKGAYIFQPYSVSGIKRNNGFYIISADSRDEKSIEVKVNKIIGAYGKSNPLDRLLKRKFSETSTPYNGVKIHIPGELMRNYNRNEIHIYTAADLYCGINGVNDGDTTICFLEKRGLKDPPVKEKLLLLRKANRRFNEILHPDADQLIINTKVYGTGSIYFGRKDPVEEGIFMTGDAAGVIAPLAGDGIGMALESAVLLRDIFIKHKGEDESEDLYRDKWNAKFKRRLITAGITQKIMLSDFLLTPGVKLLNLFPGSINRLIDYTRK
jgi:menaquinone-9 beta-reductase